MADRIRELARKLDILGITVVMAIDPVDGSTVPALNWEQLERLVNHYEETIANLETRLTEHENG